MKKGNLFWIVIKKIARKYNYSLAGANPMSLSESFLSSLRVILNDNAIALLFKIVSRSLV